MNENVSIKIKGKTNHNTEQIYANSANTDRHMLQVQQALP